MITKEIVLQDVIDNYGEWLEMSLNPNVMISDILAQKIVVLSNKIVYLERRLQDVSTAIY